MEYIEDFTGEENEKEFLEKLLLQWEKINDCKSDIQKLIVVDIGLMNYEYS